MRGLNPLLEKRRAALREEAKRTIGELRKALDGAEACLEAHGVLPISIVDLAASARVLCYTQAQFGELLKLETEALRRQKARMPAVGIKSRRVRS